MRQPAQVPADLWGLGGCYWSGEARPGGSQADGVGYSDYDGRAATLSRHRASSVVVVRGPCAALDSAPPAEPPERTSGTNGDNRGAGQ